MEIKEAQDKVRAAETAIKQLLTGLADETGLLVVGVGTSMSREISGKILVVSVNIQTEL
jgi:hypothetical protein